MSKILITGGNVGLGAEMVHALSQDGHEVLQFNLSDGDDVRSPAKLALDELIDGHLDVLINNAGVNDIDWLEDFSAARWDRVMDTNAKGIFLMTQAVLPWLIESRGTVVNVVSNASHTPMTCSAAYNASKGAAAILTRQLARELTKKYGITVFGISPNKLCDTAMSRQIDDAVVATRGWTKEAAQQYQLNALLTGEETPPAAVADFLAFLLSSKERHRFLSGCDIPYGA